jgi:hypothetical protein
MKKFKLLASFALAVSLWISATSASAQFHPTNSALTMIHVEDFSMSDTSGVGFDLGPLSTGGAPCVLNLLTEPPWFFYDCHSNGWLNLDWNDFIQGQSAEEFTFLTAFYWFVDNEGDVLKITAELAPAAPTFNGENTLYIMSLDFDGPNVHFDNGISIDGWRIEFDLADGQIFGKASTFLTSSSDGYWFGNESGSSQVFDPFFGLMYEQHTEEFAVREMIPVPAPEPSFAVALFVGLIPIAFWGKARTARSRRG